MPLLFSATPTHPCSPPVVSAGSIPNGSLWQCGECWKIWRLGRDGAWSNDHQPCEKVTTDLDPVTGITRLIKASGTVYAHLDARGNYCDDAGSPVPSPAFLIFADDVSEEEVHGFKALFKARHAANKVEVYTPAESNYDDPGIPEKHANGNEGPKHANGNGDVDQFAEQVDTVRSARKLLDEDHDTTKTVLGMIILLVIAATITISILALTGHLG